MVEDEDLVRGPSDVVRTAAVHGTGPAVANDLIAALGPGPFAHVLIFSAPGPHFEGLIEAATAVCDAPISACTTAGEISPQGYCDGSTVALAFPAAHFAVEFVEVDDLANIDTQILINDIVAKRNALAADHPHWMSEFAYALIDGVSMGEEALLRQLAPGLAGMPFFGGSAGDGRAFRTTYIAHRGRVSTGGAVVALLRSACPVRVFSLDHFSPTERRLVVTRAEPAKRIVHEINAAPAIEEYARLLGLDPQDVGLSTFAAHPLVVRFGDRHYVRGIQENLDGSLSMGSAIDEGLVLSLGEATDIAVHLRDNLGVLAEQVKPEAVLAFDCILRRIEAEDHQLTGQVSEILRDFRVVGFSSYGEQIDGLHVNHTMTGVAIYPPGPVPAAEI